MIKTNLTFLALWAALAVPCLALEGRVVGVSDGDTITVLDSGNRTHRVRLAEIDAPEKDQPFGQRAKLRMSDLCYGKLASVQAKGEDRYGRTIGIVSCNGVNANTAMVESGHAWVYRQYATSTFLFKAEKQAKMARAGLWADPSPTPPWEWRHGR